MKLTLLGTGSAFPSSDRLQTGVYLETAESGLLLDCGSGVVHRLEQAGIDYRDVDSVLLTHHHLDHVADLPTLFKARILRDIVDFTVIGPPGTHTVCEHLFAVDDLREKGNLQIEECSLEDFPRTIKGHRIRAVETTHPKTCFAYRFGDKLVVSGDTAPNQDVFSLADGVDTLVHECSFPDGIDSENHTTPSELARGLADIAVDRVVLTHLFPEAEGHLDAIRETVEEAIEAEVLVGTDLTRLTI